VPQVCRHLESDARLVADRKVERGLQVAGLQLQPPTTRVILEQAVGITRQGSEVRQVGSSDLAFLAGFA
jgi:hypothetical protein